MVVKESAYIAHYGVNGMRWGRKKSGSLGDRMRERREKAQTNKSEDFKIAAEIKKKKLSNMSNEEVRALVTRMQLEKQFKDLNPSVVTIGKKMVGDVLKETVKQELASQVRSNIQKAKAGS